MKVTKLLAAGCALLTWGVAHAQSKGDLVVGAGWLHVDSRLGTGEMSVIDPPLGSQPNTGAVASNPNTLGLTLTYFLTDNIATETWLGIPPKIDLKGTGNLSNPALNPLATARSWAPLMLFKYYIGEPTWKFRPFIGAGVAYKFDTDVRVNSAFQQVASLEFSNGATASAPSSAHFKPGFAPVVSVGANYNIDKHWALTASLTYLHFSSIGTITTHLPTTDVVSQIKIHENPLISFVGVAYRF
ncbi:OmpW/AlkL family protein [Paraburkholderia ferrariae]|uniref:OmpW/AlkL family protein n=1 Tax=Paraburkholderia ferrariae TaxID=386056 RepID=UPI000489E614|nr:OmpW family outer membrane protein [Paraburkholderia ferrariae]